MNKVFRVIWSQATQSWVAVSELTKAHKKQSSSTAKKSASGSSANLIKSSAIALALLSGHSAYAATAGNTAGQGIASSVAFGLDSKATGGNSVALGTNAKAEQNNGVAIGRAAESTGDSAVALGFQSKSTSNWSVAVGLQTNASNKQAVAVGSKSQATGENSIAIGNAANASNESSVALGSSTTSTNKFTTAVGATAFATQEGATALGYGARATAKKTIAIGHLSKAEQEGVIALGSASFAQGEDTIAIGDSAAAQKRGDIIIGKDAKSRNEGGGRSVAIGFKATAGSNRNAYEKDDASAEKRGDDGSVAIGTNAYTGLNKNNFAVNNSVALGAGAGVGYRSVGADGKPLGVGTDADDNDTVLVKAFGGTKSTLSNFNNSGTAAKDGFFSFQGVDINEGTALGRNTRAIGDQSVAIGAQSVAGMGSIVIGGNDIQAYDRKNYFKAANPTSGPANTVNDYDAPTIPGTGKNGQPITISKKYEELVGAGLDRSWRASYGQDGSTVIGMQAHSTTPLGVAIGTNSIVRKGAFGATAIGSGASILANAEAAVAIGMGAEAQGNYAVAAGTAARAKESAVAAGYQANADKSAVAVGDHSNATTSSVAVGQLAQATKEADIAVGQGAKASGEQGAIAMGLGTQAQGDSSIMIGGSEINKVAAQTVKYQKEKKDAQGRAVIKSTKKTETIGGEQIERTIRSVEMEDASGSIQNAYMELTNGRTLDTARLDYSLAANKNGHGSISMGIHSLSTGDLGTAIGTGARVTKLGGVALGTGAISELQNGVAIGTGSRVDENSKGTRQTDISYDEEGHIVPFDSKKVAYTFYWAGGTNTSEGDVVSFGTPGAERQLKNVAAGRIADDSTDAINGSQLNSVTKRMSSGWAVEAEKDHGSSGVLRLKGTEATGQSVNYATDGKSSTEGEIGTATGHVDKVRLNDEVKIRVGDNLVLNQENATRDAYEDPDNPNRKTGTHVTSKFTYSLNPELQKLKSAEFKNDAGDTTVINGAGVTITPATATGKKPVSLTENGLDNGGNPITNVAGNLDGAKTGTTAPKNKADKPNNVDDIKNNAATVGDVLNAGWNLQGNTTAKDFVTAYDTVNFVDGDGTTVSVENTDGKISTIKYSANLGDGLEKTNDNKIKVKAADKSLEVTNEGVKVKAADNTLTTDDKGLKVNTGTINPVDSGDKAGTVAVNTNDAGKIATVDTVVNAVNNAAWNATAAKTNDGENGGTVKKQAVKAGDTVTFEADKNIKIAQADGKFTFSTKDNVEFTTVKVGDTANGKKPVELKNGDVITANNNPEQPTTALNVSSDGKPTQITGVGSVLNTTPVTTTPDGSAPITQPNVVNLGTAHGQTALSPNVLNSAATVRDLANMGWKVSSDKATGADGKDYLDVVRNADEVKFVGKNAAKVSGKTVNGVRTITVDVEVPSVETAKITQNTDGSVTGPAGETLTKALKDAKDELAKLPKDADPAKVQAAKDKVNAAQKAIDDSPNSNKVATAQNVADMINNSGFTLKTSKADGGEKDAASTGDEVINPGKAVEMIAGKNLTVKQEANGKVTYSTKDNVEFTSVKVGDTQNGKAPVNFTTEAAKPANNNGTDKTPTTALNISSSDGKPTQLKGVGSVLNTKAHPTSTGKQGDTPATEGNQNLVNLTTNEDGSPLANEILNSAATVGDLANMGWVVSTKDGNGYTDVVKNANQVDFVGKNGITVTGKTGTDGVRTITVEAAQTPVVYTNKAGDKLVKVGDKFYKADEVENGKPKENAQVVPNDKVIASMNNGGNNATNNPMHLSNIGSNLPTVNDTTKQAFDPNSTAPKADKNNKSAPITAAEAAKLLDPNSNKFAGNNAATVSDVLNAGWNLQNNDEARDFVKPYDTVNFVDGINTKAVVTTDAEGKVSNVQIDVYYKESDLAGKVYDPKTKQFKNADGTALANQPTEVAGNTVKTNLVNPNAEANKAGNATQLGNVASGANTFAPVEDKKLGNDGKWYNAADVLPNGQPKENVQPVAKPDNVGKAGLIDFSKSNPNNAATVGDLQNLGWVVSAKGNDYSDQVRNANEVKFVGEGTASVTGKTDENGVRTITVKVDDQVSTNNAQTPVNYTNKDGKKVYPVKDENGNVTYHTNPDGKGEGDQTVPAGDVITSINGPEGTTTPTTLSNVAGNLDGAKKDTKAPTTEHDPVNTTNAAGPNYVNPNNAATVGDVLNAGWNLQNNGDARDFVKPYDTVNFINGKGTVAVVETADDATRSTVKFDVDAGEITADTTKPGAVKGPVTADEAKKLADDLEKAEQAVKDLPADAPKDKKAEAQKALKDAQAAAAPLNKVATAQNVADMINASGFTLKTSATADGKKESGDDEVINPGKAVEMIAGKNLTVKQEANGKVTYATKDDVSFNTVNVGEPETYKNAAGETVVKGNDGKFYKPNELNADGKPNEGATGLERDKVTVENPQVTLKREAAKEATNNDNANKPSSALNVSSSDGKPTQLKGVGSVLDATAVPTTPEGSLNGKAPTEAAKQPKLVNLTNADGSPLDDAILNSAATVRDIANMGWVVSTKDSNGYKDVVKNANQVDFVGKNGITVTGETKDGIRTITVETAQSPVVYTDKAGNKLVKAGDNFYPADSVVFGDKAYPAGSVVIGGKVYPKGTTPEQVTAGTATPATALTNGKKPADVIASMNNGDDKSANAPMQLGNVAQGAETIAPVDADGNKLVKANDGKYYPEGKVKADGSLEDGTTDADVKQPLKLANDGKWYPADQISAKGVPTDTAKAVTPPAKMDPAAGLVDFANSNPNNAATIGDLQNMGWIVGAPTNGYTDQVRNTNKVNFVGTGIATVTGETDAKGVRTITVNVANGLVDVAKNEADTATGAVTGPKKAAEDALKAAKAKLDELNNKPTATDEEKKAAQDAVNKAQSAVNNAPNLVATAQNVADMINKSGFNLKTSAAEGEKVTGTKDKGELINPGATVEMVAGKNMSVKQDDNGKVTYATKDDVEFNTVKIANPNGATYTDKNNNPLVKADDGKFYPADQVENGKVKDPAKATPVDADKVTTKAAPSVEFKAEKATPATNNTGKDKDGKTVEPTTALNISSDDGKPTQLKGVGSVLNTTAVPTAPEGTKDGKTATPEAEQPKLVNLEGKKDPKTGKVTEPLSDETLNSAATVRDIANMGWVVSTKDGNGYTDVVKNANQVDFKGGTGISVKGETTKDGVREITISVKDGEVIKPNQFTAKVNGTDTPVTKVGDQYYNTADIDPKTGEPKANVTPVTPDAGTTPTNAGDGYVTGNKVAAAIQKSGFVVGKQKDALSAADFKDEDEKVNPDDELRFADGNNTKVKLATKESVDKDGNKVTTTTVKVDVTGLPVQYTDKNGTPVTKVGDKYFTVDDKGNPTATEVKPADLTTNMVNPAAAPNVIGAPTTLGNVKSNLPSVNDADKNAKDVAGNPIAGKDNKSAPITAKEAADIANKAGNNAATVSDVLNVGWNLQNNGEARDFVKPYDTVNFINGKGTVAVVETADDAASSTVKFDVDAGEITAETKDGKATGKVVGPVPADKKPADLLKAVADAQKAVDELAKDAAATPEAKKAAQDALKAAQAAAAPLNKVATAQNVADMINASGFTLKTSATADGKKESGNDEIINPGKAVEMVAGKNLTVTQDKNGKVTYATANDVNFNSLSLGTSQHAPTLSADEDGSLRLGSKGNQAPVRISNVAPGIKDGDAVNVSQLKGVTKDLEDKIDGVAAGSNAAASLPQVYLPGKSMVAASVGTYGSQGALAVGYSSISDNGKWLIKGQVNVNTKAKTGGGVGVGYLW